MLYVDDIYHDPGRRILQDICHLVSDVSLQELHVMANRLGLKHEWFQ